MGGGGLRILGHKKWHVWRRENIERAEKDEREHAEKTRGLRDEQTRREQERRAQVLSHQTGTDSSVSEHINFFQQEEESHTKALLEGGDGGQKKKNAHANDTLGRQAQLPWYATGGEKGDTKAGEMVEDSRKNRKRKRALERQDPLLVMRPRREPDDEEAEQREDERVRRRHAEKLRKNEKITTRKHDDMMKRPSDASGSDSDERKRWRDSKKKHKKHKKHKKSSHKDDSSSREQLLAQLRREREEREAVERLRTERLMRGQ